MDIRWSYCLIGIIYVLVLGLRAVNFIRRKQFEKEHTDSIQVFSIKKDFFTTVSIICTVVTLGINGAALIGGKPINLSSIIVTLLVIGFTVINSFTYILFSEQAGQVVFLGYTLRQGDIESLKIKERSKRITFNMTFSKDIDGYNYTKVMIFGKNRKAFKELIKKLKEA